MLRRYFPPTARPQRCDITRYRILAGPERIESCWWDGRGWFLHAVFG
jgi:hypothetical protein